MGVTCLDSRQGIVKAHRLGEPARIKRSGISPPWINLNAADKGQQQNYDAGNSQSFGAESIAGIGLHEQSVQRILDSYRDAALS